MSMEYAHVDIMSREILSMEYAHIDVMSREILSMLTLCQGSRSMSTLCKGYVKGRGPCRRKLPLFDVKHIFYISLIKYKISMSTLCQWSMPMLTLCQGRYCPS